MLGFSQPEWPLQTGGTPDPVSAESPSGNGDERHRDLRQHYIREVLYLSHDPFRFTAAENEVRSSKDDFLAYFVEPPSVLWERVLSPQHLIVLGAPGSGKTALCLNAAYELNRLEPPPLVVAFTCEAIAPDAIEPYLACEITKDLVINEIARFNAVIVDAAQMDRVVAVIGRIIYPHLREVLLRAARTGDDDRIDLLWSGLGRTSTAYLRSSKALREFIDRLGHANDAEALPSLPNALASANLLGYSSVYLLVDASSKLERQRAGVVAFLASLVELVQTDGERFVLKLFLPDSFEVEVAGLAQRAWAAADTGNHMISLAWNEAQLEQLFQQRLRAAQRPDIVYVHDLLGPDPEDKSLLNFWRSLRQLPRNLLEIISKAIDAHIQSPDRDSITIAPQVWNNVGT